MNTVAFHTLGCKVNYTETSAIARQFLQKGFNVIDQDGPCDIFVLNTCSVTERADRECRQVIRRVLRYSPDAYVIVIGCYAQLQPEEIAAIDGVDLILGTKEKFNIFDFTGNFSKRAVPQIFVSCIDEVDDFDPSDSGKIFGRTRAYLKVQDGCDYACAFCTIPRARGASRSHPVDNIVRQAQLLAEQGYREIVLTGINVGDYGKKIGTRFFDLLKALDRIRDIQRLRISSVEPNLLTGEMIDLVLSSERFCNHFHIPLQSGSDTILRMMRRRSLKSEYERLVSAIKTKDPSAAIGADVLVGFPGETEKLFNETHLFLADLPISYLHVFTYSERENTPAAEFPGRVSLKVRKERNEILRLMSSKKRTAFHASFVGSTVPVLFENRTREGNSSGLTTNYIRVDAPSEHDLVNEIRCVTISEVRDDHCTGRIVVNEKDAGRMQCSSPRGSLEQDNTIPFIGTTMDIR